MRLIRTPVSWWYDKRTTWVADGHTVPALTRGTGHLPGGVTAVAGDLGDPAPLTAAYRGADAVVVQLPLIFDPTAVDQARNVLTALESAGVARAVVDVGGPVLPGPVGVPHLDGRVVGPAGPYLENLSAPWSAPLVDAGEIRYPVPAVAPVPWVALDDVAAAVSAAHEDGAPAGRSVVTGPEALTGPELAAAVSTGVGRAVTWTTIPARGYGAMLTPHVGAEVGRGIAAACEGDPGQAPEPGPALVHTGVVTAAAWAEGQDRGRAEQASAQS